MIWAWICPNPSSVLPAAAHAATTRQCIRYVQKWRVLTSRTHIFRVSLSRLHHRRVVVPKMSTSKIGAVTDGICVFQLVCMHVCTHIIIIVRPPQSHLDHRAYCTAAPISTKCSGGLFYQLELAYAIWSYKERWDFDNSGRSQYSQVVSFIS